MKLHTKFAFIVCCAATFSLLSSRAATIPSPGGSRRVEIHAAECHHSRGRHGTVDLGCQRPQLDLWDTWESRWVMGLGHSKYADLSLATSSRRQGPSITSAAHMASVAV